ncbi:MAG: AarF/ABC1/UbiB kinase family protein [Actinomycetota bacterium]|nr:AarF/ABC1/UbiB kinase family protein [Actinomycetota bacterium]
MAQPPTAGDRDAAEEPGTSTLGSRAQRGATLAKLSASTGTGYLGTRVRRLREGEAAEARFHAATAEKLLELLGSMKGAAMKLGQIASFVDLDLPPEAQETYHDVLAQLRDAAPPFDPERIAAVVTEDFGAPPEVVFASWDPVPIAAASIGQVHRATLPDGTAVVAKVQYPGVAEAVESDLANAELFTPLARMFSPNLRVRPLLDELRERVADELDYQREAQYQDAFFQRYDGHPFIRIPRVYADWCRPRVLTSEYVAGASFDAMLAGSDDAQRQRYGEIIYRFVFGSLNRFRLFNADPHPGNYLFPGDGSVVFLDFGSVKLFRSATRAQLQRQVRAIIAGDARELEAALRDAGFIASGQRVDAQRLLSWFRAFNEPMLEDGEWTYTPEFARSVIRSTTDPRAGWMELLRKLNLPPDYLALNRIQWGVNSILGRLRATANWHRIGAEFHSGAEPATELGQAEAAFLRTSPFLA